MEQPRESGRRPFGLARTFERKGRQTVNPSLTPRPNGEGFAAAGARRVGRAIAVIALASITVGAACSGTGVVAPAATSAATVGPSVPAATSAPTPSPSASYPVSFVDDEGTTVTLKAPPVKIASLTPAETETLFAIGAGDRVVANA